MLLLCRPFISHIIHLDHETRGESSAADAAFVADLAQRLSLPITLHRRSDLEPLVKPTANRSAHYRRLRLTLYRQVVSAHHLAGVLQAHHADDQAETITLRLLRGSTFEGLTGIAPTTTLNSLTIHRPLLSARKADLIAYLNSIHQPWREDASNTSPAYARNRIRATLTQHPHLIPPLLHLATAARSYREALTQHLPAHTDTPRIAAILDLPLPLQRHWARRYLSRAIPNVEAQTVNRLLHWLQDAALGPRLSLPQNHQAKRTNGTLHLIPPSPPPSLATNN